MSVTSAYPAIASDSAQQEAADVLAALERVREALGVAIDDSRAAARITPHALMAQALTELSDMLDEAASDSALDRHIRVVDAALAAYSESGFNVPIGRRQD
jgi:AcrR family transcriptional regulator